MRVAGDREPHEHVQRLRPPEGARALLLDPRLPEGLGRRHRPRRVDLHEELVEVRVVAVGRAVDGEGRVGDELRATR